MKETTIITILIDAAASRCRVMSSKSRLG